MNVPATSGLIVDWVIERAVPIGKKGFVVAVSGGVDSAVVSTIAAKSALEVKCLMLPIHQRQEESDRGMEHCKQLAAHYPNVTYNICDLTKMFEDAKEAVEEDFLVPNDSAAYPNLRSRIRMGIIYTFANALDYLVLGTGNRIEDCKGIGFFTKYGDGGVDISPIGNMTKTQVYELAKHLQVPMSIQKAAPTDGIWEDGRTDEDQIGATYKELEAAMEFCEDFGMNTFAEYIDKSIKLAGAPHYREHHKRVTPSALQIYLQRHMANAHKMQMPPIGPEAVV